MKTTGLKLFVDGASRGNPGKAGAGIAFLQEKEVLLKKGFYLGPCLTNNQAEYMALLIGLKLCHKNFPDITKLEVFSDSQLLIRQLEGVYRVRQPHLASLKEKAVGLTNSLDVKYFHILREKNALADQMANQGIDEKQILPKYLADLCADQPPLSTKKFF